ncbi:MAG TPA: hypothetical protein VHA33_11405 [Candidatus Angelobacter sp.]|jgi:hypothetical protein|nr:hypothetical protein [Candidatus Angelobacter sp.]
MTLATLSLSEIAAFWRSARRLYMIYAELDRTFEIGAPPCRDLEYPIDRSEPEVIGRVRQWFDQMDSHVQVWQLRQLLQSTNLQTEENLRDLIQRHMAKLQRTEIDRDKVDFLLVQYFAHCAPQGLYERQITLEEVARVLAPVLGGIPPKFPEWSSELDKRLEQLNQCQSLEHLQDSGALVEARELKLETGKDYFEPACLIGFTRFNFLARRAFFRAMHLDLHAIRNCINQLERLGFASVDCTAAGLSARESLEQVRHLVHQWKTPFRAPYSGGSSFLQLIQLRHVLEQTLERAHRQALAPNDQALAPNEMEAKAVQPSAQTAEEPIAASSVTPVEDVRIEPESAPAQSQGSTQEFVVEQLIAAQTEEPPKTAQVIPIDIQKQKEAQQAAPEKAAAAKAAASEPTILPEQPPKSTSVVHTGVGADHHAGTDHRDHGYLDQCVADITQQLLATPAKKSPTVRPILLAGCKLLIATWEAEAFTDKTNEISVALRRAVAARTILHVCIERHKKHEPTDVGAALEIANRAVDEMREHVAKAKESKNIDAAVNLAATTKRLLSLLEEGERLRQ